MLHMVDCHLQVVSRQMQLASARLIYMSWTNEALEAQVNQSLFSQSLSY